MIEVDIFPIDPNKWNELFSSCKIGKIYKLEPGADFSSKQRSVPAAAYKYAKEKSVKVKCQIGKAVKFTSNSTRQQRARNENDAGTFA